jgi:hypothetical protein
MDEHTRNRMYVKQKTFPNLKLADEKETEKI